VLERKAWTMWEPPPNLGRSDAVMDQAGVSRGHSSERGAHEGPNVKPRMDTPSSRRRADRSQLTLGEPSKVPTR